MMIEPDDNRDPVWVWVIGWLAMLALSAIALAVVMYFLFSRVLP